MSALLLVPYNDSMRLGQGYNSFLQAPCLHNAMEVEDLPHVQKPIVSQTVSYSSRVVTSISDVVGSMNISAGSSIKSGTILLAGNTQSIDTLKFTESDINAIISVKVVNQTIRVKETSKMSAVCNTEALQVKTVDFTAKDIAVAEAYAGRFGSFDDDNATSASIDEESESEGSDSSTDEEDSHIRSKTFFEHFGDCYISSFIDGGELHGIISIKVLDKSRIGSMTSRIKSLLNNSNASELVLSPGLNGSRNSPFKEALTGTEVTISVSWSGGGQIKPPLEDWSLDALLDAAAAFPGNVAKHPYHTRAVLTKYTTNAEFLYFSNSKGITLPDYANVQSYSADLLDMYVGYKANLAVIRDVLARPMVYDVRPVANAVSVDVRRLIEVRKVMKAQMILITQQIDQLNHAPETLNDIEAESKVQSPELWAARLPVLKAAVSESGKHTVPKTLQELAEMFPDKRQAVGDPTPLKGRLVPVRQAATLEHEHLYEPKEVPGGFAMIGHTTSSSRALVISAWSDSSAIKHATGFDEGVKRTLLRGEKLFARLPTYVEDDNYKALTGIANSTADHSKIAMVHQQYLTPLRGPELRVTRPSLMGFDLPINHTTPKCEDKTNSGIRFYDSHPWLMEPTSSEAPVLWMIKEDAITVIDDE